MYSFLKYLRCKDTTRTLNTLNTVKQPQNVKLYHSYLVNPRVRFKIYFFNFF